jgi:hypothetical protein
MPLVCFDAYYNNRVDADRNYLFWHQNLSHRHHRGGLTFASSNLLPSE